MPRKTSSTDINNIILKYRAGIPVNDIAGDFSLNVTTIYRILKKNGVDTSYSPISLPLDEITELFNSGIGVRGIADRFNVSHNVVNRIFKENSIQTRNRSEQQFARMANTTAQERKQLAMAANQAKRGLVTPFSTRCQMAKTRQKRLTYTVQSEIDFAKMLSDRGIETTLQTAVGPYNCDLTSGTVAVEIWGGYWHWHGRHVTLSHERFNYILNLGWTILVIPDTANDRITESVADYAASFIQESRRNPSLRGKYRMIWGAGEFETTGSVDDDEFSFEPPFTGSRDPSTGKYIRVPR